MMKKNEILVTYGTDYVNMTDDHGGLLGGR